MFNNFKKKPAVSPEVELLLQRARSHSITLHAGKIDRDCPTCMADARELHRLSGNTRPFEEIFGEFLAHKERASRPAKGTIKQSIPREGRIEDIVPEIFAHDQAAHGGDGEVHSDCEECMTYCRRCLAAIGMTPQDYLDSFDALPTVSMGGMMRPDILKEIAEELVAKERPKVENPWSFTR